MRLLRYLSEIRVMSDPESTDVFLLDQGVSSVFLGLDRVFFPLRRLSPMDLLHLPRQANRSPFFPRESFPLWKKVVKLVPDSIASWSVRETYWRDGFGVWVAVRYRLFGTALGVAAVVLKSWHLELCQTWGRSEC